MIDEQIVKDLELSTPATEAANKAKDNGQDPQFLVIGGKEYIYRGLTRKEWRKQVKKQNQQVVDAGEDVVKVSEIQEDAKEELVNLCVIYKKDKEFSPGAVETLAEAILVASGFGPPDTDPVAL